MCGERAEEAESNLSICDLCLFILCSVCPLLSITDRIDPSVYLCFGGIHVILILTEFQRCRYTLDTKIVGERALLERRRIVGR